jgi:pimeloyl-ACP methyl ester carboxylesterase
VPGEPRLTLEFLEVKGVPRKPLRTLIQDPGSTRLQFYVRDLEETVTHFKSTGGRVVSVDGKPVSNVAPNVATSIIVRDLNNFFIILTHKPAATSVGAGQERPSAVTPDERAGIEDLLGRYLIALGGCQPEKYAALFAPDGFFAAGGRGRVDTPHRLMEMVKSYDCEYVNGAPPAHLPTPVPPHKLVLERTASGIIGFAYVNGARYEDEYVQTANGWLFKSRTVVTDKEQAAHVTHEDFEAIQQLAVKDGGPYADRYESRPDGTSRFKHAGVALSVSAEGVKGKAYLENGAHYEDLYVKDPGGWTRRSRTLVAADAATVDGAKIHWTSTGQGARTIVFVHGWMCDETSWSEQVPDLAKKYRVITMDLPGHGQSDAPKEGQWSMDLFARAVDAVRAEAKADRIIVVGHSMGVPVVYRYAQMYPTHTAALVLVDGTLFKASEARARVEGNVQRVSGKDGLKNREEMIQTFFAPATTPVLRERIRTMMMRGPESSARGAMQTMADPETWNDHVLQVPTMAIYSGTNRGGSIEITKTYLPNLEFVNLPGTGHFLMMERPAEFNRHLQAFIDRQGS